MPIPPMLAARLEDPRRLADPRFRAEPKLDGQRAQLHVPAHRVGAGEIRGLASGDAARAFIRRGRELIRLLGLAWLREIRWPITSAVLDGEAGAGDGSARIPAVLAARHRPGSQIAFAAFDLLELDGHSRDHPSFAGRAGGDE